MAQPGEHRPSAGRSGDQALPDRFLARVVQASHDPYVVLALDGTILYVSDAIEGIIGAPPEDVTGRHMLEVLTPEGSEAAIAAFEAFTSPARQDIGWSGPALTVRLQHAAGHPVSCRVLTVPSGDPDFDGLVLRIRLTESNEKLDAAIASLVHGDPIAVTLSHILAFATEQMPYSIGTFGLGHDGTSFDSVVAHRRAPFQQEGRALLPGGADLPWNQIIGSDRPRYLDATSLPEPVRSELARAGFPWCWVLPLHHRGRDSDVLVFWRLAPGPPGPHLAEAIERITRLAQLALDAHHTRRLLERQANTDELTGLANRTALGDHLQALSDAAHPQSIGVLYCDLDDFKPINDTFGHIVGDQVLKAAAHRIASNVRSDDLACRLGGDEFVVVCAGTSEAELSQLADRLLDAFATPITAQGRQVEVGISVGVALVDPATGPLDPERLLDRADEALLRAKAGGKGRWSSAD